MVTELLPPHNLPLDIVLWNRVIHVEDPDFAPEFARQVMGWGFEPRDQARIAELLERNREGALTAEELAELDSYERVGHLLNMLHAKAQLSLKRCGAQPR